MGGMIYTEICPVCGEEYSLEYRAETDEFVRITKCKCDRLSDAIEQVLREISEFKAEYKLHPGRYKKRDIAGILDRIQTKLEMAL